MLVKYDLIISYTREKIMNAMMLSLVSCEVYLKWQYTAEEKHLGIEM